MRGPPETVLVLGSSASLACPEIRSRGAAGSSGEESPSCSVPTTFSPKQILSHKRLARLLGYSFCFLLFCFLVFLSGKWASATLLFQIQSNHNTKRLKRSSMRGANYKKNDRKKTKRGGKPHSDPSRGGKKHFKGLPDEERVLQLWLTSSLVVKSHWTRTFQKKKFKF